jgi:hypothetical protein
LALLVWTALSSGRILLGEDAPQATEAPQASGPGGGGAAVTVIPDEGGTKPGGAAVTVLPNEAPAGLVKVGPDASVSVADVVTVKVGAGLRASVRMNEDSAPDGSTYSTDLGIENARLYLSGGMLGFIHFELNTEISSNDDVHILDAVGKFEPHPYFNVWAGRFLPPSDRANLDGPFFLNVWDFPFVQNYPAIFAGRDDGVAVWGQAGEGVFKWQFGVFEGTQGEPNSRDHVLYAGRLTLNLLDPEPGYYNSSTYYGDKDVLAFGIAGMFQEQATGTLSDAKNFSAFNIDVLFEKKWTSDIVGDVPGLTDGVLTIEGAYYFYDDDDLHEVVPLPGETLFGDTTRQGSSGFVTVSYLIPKEVSFGKWIKGKFQPFFRFQGYNRAERDVDGVLTQGIDIGTHFVMKGHNARIALAYQNRDRAGGGGALDTFLIGAQLQF